MKIRTGFVSNSSSCSFVIKRQVLSDEQLQRIRDYVNCGGLEKCKTKETRCLGCRDDFWQYNDHGWRIEVDDEKVFCETSMANFDLYCYVTMVLDVHPRDVEDVDDNEAIDLGGRQSQGDYYAYMKEEEEQRARYAEYWAKIKNEKREEERK